MFKIFNEYYQNTLQFVQKKVVPRFTSQYYPTQTQNKTRQNYYKVKPK